MASKNGHCETVTLLMDRVDTSTRDEVRAVCLSLLMAVSGIIITFTYKPLMFYHYNYTIKINANTMYIDIVSHYIMYFRNGVLLSTTPVQVVTRKLSVCSWIEEWILIHKEK